MKENYIICYGNIRYCSLVQLEGTIGMPSDKEKKEGFLPSQARGGWLTTFGNGPPASWDELPVLNITIRTHFAVLSLQIWVHNWRQMRNSLLAGEKTISCVVRTVLPSLERQRPSIYPCPSPVLALHGAHVWERPMNLGWSLEKSRRDRTSQVDSSKVCADTQQSRNSPCITPVRCGGCTPVCIPLGGTDEKGMSLVILICL